MNRRQLHGPANHFLHLWLPPEANNSPSLSRGTFGTECSNGSKPDVPPIGSANSSTPECSNRRNLSISSKIAVLRCLSVRIIEGSPSISTAEEYTSATAKNLVPAKAGTSVLAGSAGATAPAISARVAPQPRLWSTPQHHIISLFFQVQFGTEGRPNPRPIPFESPHDSSIQFLEKIPPPKEASPGFSPPHSLSWEGTAEFLQPAASPSYFSEIRMTREPPTKSLPSLQLERSAPFGSHLPPPLQCGPIPAVATEADIYLNVQLPHRG